MGKVIVVAVAVVAFAGGYLVGKRAAPKPNATGSAAITEAEKQLVVPTVAVANDSVVAKAKGVMRVEVPLAGVPRGTADGPITIVEFADYQCPFSARVTATIDELLSEYPGKIRFYFRHYPLPFHPDAKPAAEAALAAEAEGKFWEMHDKLFANSRNLKREDLERYAVELGLDMTRFKQALDTRQYQGRVEDDLNTALKAGARGTPAFFINGRLLSGARPLEAFKEVVEEELAEAAAVVAEKTPVVRRR
jgi:protein-disulfide isomerase